MKPILLKSRKSKKIAAGLTVFLIAVVLVPMLVPISSIKPEIESQLSKALGRTVHVGRLTFSMFPTPRIVARQVSIRRNKEQGISAGRISIIPRLGKLLFGELVIRHIDLRNLEIDRGFLVSWIDDMRASSSGEAETAVIVQRVTGKSITIKWDKNIILGPYKIDLRLAKTGDLNTLQLYRHDKAAMLTVSASGDAYAMRFSAKRWSLQALDEELVFDRLNMSGSIRQDRVNLSKVSAKVFGGSLEGSAGFSWKDSFRILGKLQVSNMKSGPVMRVFGYPVLDGRYSGEVRLNFSGASADRLLDHPIVEGSVQLVNGTIYYPAGKKKILDFDKINLTGRLNGPHLVIKSLKSHSYSGTLSASGEMDWKTDWRIAGKLSTKGINIEALLDDLTGEKYISGKLTAGASIKLRSRKASHLLDHPYLEGKVHFVNGAVFRPGKNKKILKFKSLKVRGRLASSKFKLKSLYARAYGGKIKARGDISWKSGWAVNATLDGKKVNTGPMLGDLLGRKSITGKFTGYANVRLRSRKAVLLMTNPDLNGEFHFSNGVIYKADLEKATTNFSKDGISGGQTPFEILQGRIVIKNHSMKITNLEIKSPSMEARGDVNVNPQKQLDGVIEVGVRRTATLVSIPIQVAGTLDEPSLRPTNGALVGGAVGTSILGPGLGTVVGIKVSNFFRKLGNRFKNNGDNVDWDDDDEED